VEKAVWDESQGQWELTVQDVTKKESFVTKAEVLINAAGFLR
jgi:glycerol-3-phosphate dehydrogenase